MKKALITILILSLSLLLVACGANKTQEEMVKEKISYEETSLLFVDNEDYRIEIMSIKGEVDPLHDGKVGECKVRTTVKLLDKGLKVQADSVPITLSNDGSTCQVTLIKDVLGVSYSAHLEEGVLNFTPLEVTISDAKDEKPLALTSALDRAKLDSNMAFMTAFNGSKEDLTTYFDEKNYLGEVQIKLIHASKMPDSPYYYYVSFIKNTDECVSCLVDPWSGKLLNKKVK